MARFYCFLFVANIITYAKIVLAKGPTTTDVDADSDYKLMIEDTVRLFEVDDRFLSVAFSAGQLNKTDTGINLDSVRLRNLLKALSPSYMRVGGTRANFLVFEAREDGDIINKGVENTTANSDNANKTGNPIPDTKPVTAKPVVQHEGETLPTTPPTTPPKTSEDIGADDASSNRPQPISKPDNAKPLNPSKGDTPSAGPPPPCQSNLSEDHGVAASGEDELESPEKATSSNSAVGAEEEEENKETSDLNFPYPPEKGQQIQDEQYNPPGPNQEPPLKSNDSDEDFYEKKPIKIATPSQGKKNKKLKKLKKTKKVSKRPLMVTGQDVENSNTDKEKEEENLDVNSENQKLEPEGNEPENEISNAEADRENGRASEDIGEEDSEVDGDDYNETGDENKVSNSESDGIDSENASEENEAEASENQNEITEDNTGNEIENENEGNETEEEFRNEEESPIEQNENSQNEESKEDETTNESEQDLGQDSSDETERQNSDVNQEDQADELPAELEKELPGEDEHETEEGSENPDNEDQHVPDNSEQEPHSENGTNEIVTDAETEDSNTEGDTEEDTMDEASSFGPKNENNPIILPELQTTPTTSTSTGIASTLGPEKDDSSINLPELYTTPTPTTTASTDQSTESNLDVLFGILQTTNSPTTEKIITAATASTTSSSTTTTTKRPKKFKKPIIVTLPPTVKLPPLETTTPVPFKKKKMKSVKTVHDNENKLGHSLGVDLPSLLVTTTATTTTTTAPKTRNKKNKEKPIFQLPENENDEIFLISSTAKPHSTEGKSTLKQVVTGSHSKPTSESGLTSTGATTQTKPSLETTETLEDFSMILSTTTTTSATTTPSTTTAKPGSSLIQLGPVSEGLSKHKKKQPGKKLSLNTKKPIKNQNKNSYKNNEKSKSKDSKQQSKFKDFKLNMKKKTKNRKKPFGSHLQKQKLKAKSQKQVKVVDKIIKPKQDKEPLRLPTPPTTTVFPSTSLVTDVLGYPILSNSHTKKPTQKASTAKSTESFSTGKSTESLITTTISPKRLPTVTASPSVTLSKSKIKQSGKSSKQPPLMLPTVEPPKTKKTTISSTKVIPVKLTSTTPSMENDYPLILSTTSEPVTTTPVLSDIELSPAFKNYFPNQKPSKERLFDRQYENLVNDDAKELYGEQFYDQPIVHYYKREEIPRNVLKHQQKRGKVLYPRNQPLKRYERQVSRKLSKAKQDKLDKLRGYKNFNLTADAFDKLVQLAEDGDMRIIFDFNAFLREINTQWDPKNAKKLLDYIKLRGYKLDYQLGNEPNHYNKFGDKRNYSAQQIGQDFLLLKKVIKSKKLKGKPLIIGPDVTRPKGKRVSAWLNTFLAVAKKAIDVLAWHQYYIDGRTATVENFTDPNILDKFKEQAQEMNSIRFQNSFKKPVWLTETASAWGGGAKGLSDRYADGFMYLDKLGIAAQENISVVARQSFMTGKYALVNMKNNYEPHPSYYLAVLFKRLIGKVVLGINGGDSKFRVYAHCSKATQRRIPGSVTVYGINLNEKAVTFSFSGYQLLPVKQFLLTADSLDSDEVKLNGKVLKMDGDHLPKMLGIIVRQPIKIPAKSFGFYVLDQVSAEAC